MNKCLIPFLFAFQTLPLQHSHVGHGNIGGVGQARYGTCQHYLVRTVVIRRSNLPIPLPLHSFFFHLTDQTWRTRST